MSFQGGGLKTEKVKAYGKRSNWGILLQKCKVIPSFGYGKFIFTTHFPMF